MKKIIVIFMILGFVCGMSALSSARGSGTNFEAKGKSVKGTVVSVDTNRNEIVIKEEVTQLERTVSVSTRTASLLKPGDQAEVSLKEGADAVKVTKIAIPKSKMDKE